MGTTCKNITDKKLLKIYCNCKMNISYIIGLKFVTNEFRSFEAWLRPNQPLLQHEFTGFEIYFHTHN